MSKEISFEEAYAQATNEAIKILGNVVSKIVTDYLQDKYSVHITKTAASPAALDEALEHAIDGGRLIIERRLVKLLYEKLGLQSDFKKTNDEPIIKENFVQKVEAARRIYTIKGN
jgi:hypothetical protein